MNTFILQSLLLIAVAYFFGAVIGCWLRKMFKKSASMLHRERDELTPAGSIAAAGAVGTAGGVAAMTKFAGEEGEASIQINRPEVRIEPEPEVIVEAIAEPDPQPVEVAPVVVARIAPSVERETITFVEPEPIPQAVVEEIVIVPEPIAELAPEVKSVPVPQIVVRETAPVIDDLTRIKGVGLPVALELKKNGIIRFEQVASWNDEDVAHISETLGFSGRIERENWMDQAKILASGNDLEFTTHQISGAERGSRSTQETGGSELSASAMTATGARTIALAQTQETQTASGVRKAIAGGDDLRQLVGIGTVLEEKLNALGITRFAQIAAWTPSEVEAISRQLDFRGRIERENWIEQAKKLDI